MRRYAQAFLMSSILLAACASSATAQVVVSGAGGIFSPFDGSAGPSGLVGVAGTSSNWLFGGEFEYRGYKSTILDVADVSVDSFSLRGVVHYNFRSEGITPYVGAGVGISVNVIDGNRIERESTTIIDVTDAGAGIGVLGLVGLDIPLGSAFSIFGEGRVGADFQLTSQTGGSDEIGAENLGGISGLGGVRVRF